MPDAPVDLVARRYTRNTAIAAVVIAVGWHVGEDLPAMILGWSDYRWPAVVAAAWLTYAVVAVVAAVAILRAEQPMRHAWAYAAITLALTAVVAASAHGQLLTLPSWAWGAVGWLAVMLYWHRPVWHLVAFLAANAAVGLAVLVAAGTLDRVSIARYLMVVAGSTALQLGFAGGARALQAAADWTAAASAAQAEIHTERRAAGEVHRTRLRRFHALQQTAGHFLAGLADRSARPGDPAVQRRCAIEAARLRRLFLETDDLPDPLVDDIWACADVADRKGIVVDMAVVGDLPTVPADVRKALVEPAGELLAAARTRARITLAGLGDQVVVSVIADTDLTEVTATDTARVTVNCHREGDRLWVETRWADPSPSPSSRTIPLSSKASDPGSTRHATRSR